MSTTHHPKTQPSSFTFRVRSYEGDAWGRLPASGLLRYLEQAAISAAGERGFGRDFHAERGSTWVIRRMALQFHLGAYPGDDLLITTWLSHLDRVRGGREYRVNHAETGLPIASALAEWVYLDRARLRPLPLPDDLISHALVPGAPLGNYDPPSVRAMASPHVTTTRRVAQWYECDSHGHVNNSVYADWLDESVRAAVASLGYPTATLKAAGLHIRGVHYQLDYKRAALPEDPLIIETHLLGSEGSMYEFWQTISVEGGSDLLTAKSVYIWLTDDGAPSEPPHGWPPAVVSG